MFLTVHYDFNAHLMRSEVTRRPMDQPHENDRSRERAGSFVLQKLFVHKVNQNCSPFNIFMSIRRFDQIRHSRHMVVNRWHFGHRFYTEAHPLMGIPSYIFTKPFRMVD